MAIEDEAYCTLVMTDSYLPGAAVLAHSLRDSGTKKKLAALVTLQTLRADTIEELKSLYDYVIPVDRIPNPNPANLYLIDRGDLLYAFTKINLWRLVQFKKVVYIDADVVALRAPDELFETKENFAAASDIGWPDFFNSGVMVLKPDMGTYWALQTLAASGDSFDGADQGLLNQYYEHKDWKRLPFTYNCTPSASYQYEPAYRYHKSNISMVHFIGQSKPWQKGRTMSQKGSGAYKELVNRWWAVYDLHYKLPTYGMQGGPRSNVVKSFVMGEATSADYGYSSVPQAQPSVQQTQQAAPPPQIEAPVITVEAPPSDPADHAEQIVQEMIEPTPTVEQRRFSAPINEWDATRAPPPEASRPEAVNFPTQNYEFNADPTPYQPPQSYPEPPKDMWYEVPKEKPLPPAAKPKAIFPWEERQVAKPTRVFIEDIMPTNSTNSESEDPGLSRTTTNEKDSDSATPTTPTIKINDELPQTMPPITKNAWDDVAGIDTYVRQLNTWQKLRGKLQVLQNTDKHSQSPAQEIANPLDQNNTAVLSPAEDAYEPTGGQRRTERRESLILTKFPTADERPSLPVTPAPIKRSSFWGTERNEEGQLPTAEGVPDQADWDPNAQLEALRASSIALKPESLKMHAKNVPRRDMPRSSIDVGQHPGLIGSATSSPGEKPRVEHHVRFGGVVEVKEPVEKGKGVGATGRKVEGEPVGEKVESEKGVRVGGTGGMVKGNGNGGGVRFGDVKFQEPKVKEAREEVVSPTEEIVESAA
ncbi:Glycogenin-like protein [Elsinoe fawcettii]|nr:Glycogenin-like protein [Elsinoe fawcettii]